MENFVALKLFITMINNLSNRGDNGPYRHIRPHPTAPPPTNPRKPNSKTNKLLCWVMTRPLNHKTKATSVNETWGKRCDQLLFFSSTHDPSIPTIALPGIKDGREYLWGKTKKAFTYIYEHHLEDADWFMKADDDTYVVVENAKALVAEFDPSSPIYLGSRFKMHVPQGYMSGGAGYILSKEAVKRFVQVGLGVNSTHHCRADNGGAEDVELGKCMFSLNVQAGDTRDKLGRHRFLPLIPEQHFNSHEQLYHDVPWYKNYLYYPQQESLNCCSDSAVSFHYVTPMQMKLYEYMIYHLKADVNANKSDNTLRLYLKCN